MIDKITNQNQIARHKLAQKINELIDAVNSIVSVQEKLIDSRFVVEIKNTPQPIKLYVCADGSVYGNEDVAKSHAASIFNPLPTGATTTDRVYLERELDRTRKALAVAVDALKLFDSGQYTPQPDAYGLKRDASRLARKTLEQITALEQKDVK